MPITKIIKVDPDAPDEKTIEFAATLLKDGGLVAFPTETVYGIGANLMDEGAVKRLYDIKKRPLNKPFTVHISNIDTVTELGCEISPLAEKLIKEFWPGPLTIVLKKRNGTCGFRMPRNKIAKDLISKSRVPVIAPSANISGQKPPTRPREILETLDGKIDLIIESGATGTGTESTVVDLSRAPYRILRKGAISEEDIARVAENI